MLTRAGVLTIWALVAASVVYWLLLLLPSPLPLPAGASLAVAGAPAGVDLARLLGAPPSSPTLVPITQPALAARFRLTGVIALRDASSGHAAYGIALIAVDGKPPQPYRVGQSLGGELVLQSVTLRGAAIGPPGGAVLATLDLPLPQPPAQSASAPGSGAPLPLIGVPAPALVAPAVIPTPGDALSAPSVPQAPDLRGTPASQ